MVIAKTLGHCYHDDDDDDDDTDNLYDPKFIGLILMSKPNTLLT